MLYMADAYMGKAHVTADQIGDYNAGVSGSGCVLNVGEKLRAEIVNTNLVRIYDGAFIFQGYRRSGITAGSYEDVTIENGTQAQKRNDLICAKYEKDSTTSKENLTLVVIKGTPGGTASDPEIPEGDVRSGSAVCYMPLYRVRLDGINLAAVEKLFTVRKTMKEIEDDVTALNNKLANIFKIKTQVTKSDGDGDVSFLDLAVGIPIAVYPLKDYDDAISSLWYAMRDGRDSSGHYMFKVIDAKTNTPLTYTKVAYKVIYLSIPQSSLST